MSGVVTIRGKDYKTVALRSSEFRKDYPEHSVITKIIHNDNEKVVMFCKIKNEHGRVLATGYAEEERGVSNINTTSALENCETSAIGRALAALGYVGHEYATEEDIKAAQIVQRLIQHNDAWKRHFDSVAYIKHELSLAKQAIDLGNEGSEGHLACAWEAMCEIPDDDRRALRVAPTKGGCFTVDENKLLKQAKDEDFDAERGVYRSIADKAEANG